MDNRAALGEAQRAGESAQAAREGKLAHLISREGRRLASLLAKLGQLEDAHAIAQVLTLRDHKNMLCQCAGWLACLKIERAGAGAAVSI